LLKQSGSFLFTKAGYRSPWCKACTSEAAKGYQQAVAPEVQAQRNAKGLKRAQDATLPKADRWGERWTPEEEAIAMDMTMTMIERALALGRSFKAVGDKVYKIQRGQS
jgi:hypothetical protein